MDYRDFEQTEQGKKKEPGPRTVRADRKRWWMETDPALAAAAVWDHQRALEENQSYRQDELVRYARLFGNKDMASLRPFEYAKPTAYDSHRSRTSLNVIKSGTESVVAMTCSARPRPSYLTDGGNFGQREKAKKLNKFTRGQFYEERYYEVAPQIATDAGAWGTGCIKAFAQDGRACIERVYSGQLYVDELESVWGKPRQMFQAMPIARDVLREMFPEADQAAIEDATPEETGGQQFLGDMVRVVEAWHLRSGKKAKDGKHLICTSAGILGEVDDWEKDYFPFAFLRWSNPLIGFWGNGIAEQLLGKQYEINKLALRIQKMMHFSIPRVFLPDTARIPKNLITNEIAEIIPYAGTQLPVFMAPAFVPPEYFGQIQTLKGEAFEELGVSQMMATGNKEPGINSGVALRERSDIQSSRFVQFGQKYEQLSLDVGKLLIDITRDISRSESTELDKDGKPVRAKPKSYLVRMPDKKFVESIDWADIDLEEDQYVMQAFPVSSLPSTPAARQETVVEWIAQGWVSPEEGRRLLDFPDLEQSTSLAVAQLDDIDRTIDELLAGKKYRPPEPMQALELGAKRALSAYLRARSEGYPQRRLMNLQTWIIQAQRMAADAAAASNQSAPTPPGMAPPVPDPLAPPGPPPEPVPVAPAPPIAA